MTTIPGPPGLPIVGNVNDIDASDASSSFVRLAETYGDIYRINILGRNTVIVNTQVLADEACDERRFYKKPAGALEQVRNGVGDGLFTAFEDEPNWGLAHRVLMPNFGPFAIQGMFDEMHEIAAQMVSRWARLGPSHAIDPSEDFTKLALDSIALCGMGTRFNSFYRDDMHPFINAMGFFLAESGARSLRPKFVTDYMYRANTRKYHESIELMKDTAKQAIEERRTTPSSKKDLLNAMLEGVDSKTGKKMNDEVIINNAITFLIAGHETTAGTLGFLFVGMLKNPAVLARAQKEVDEVVGTGPITVEHMSKLPYISACIRETLRLFSPITATAVKTREDQGDQLFLGPEKYIINQGDSVVFNLPKIHKDPAVYGEDADEFKPDRMLDENFNKLPPNSWKPFGNGQRACIGRGFAWQEMHLVIALILQNFNLRATDPAYVLKNKVTLTIKPKDFTMNAMLRSGLDPVALEKRVWGGKEPEPQAKGEHLPATKSTSAEKPMTILYGSNTGTCEALAQNLANNAASRGYKPEVLSMDVGADGELPKDQPLVVITASYEGEPPDNAVHFVEYVKSLKGEELKGTKFAVFGCGNHDWVNTFHKIPKLCDNSLGKFGGSRICEIGLSDVAENHIFDDFDQWTDKHLWPGVAKEYGVDEEESTTSIGLDIDLQPSSRASDLRHDVQEAVVVENRSLTAPGEPEKRHIEITLPTETRYAAGDYLAVLPVNPDKVVRGVMARFKLPWDARVTIKAGQHTFLPTNREMSVFDLLSAYVELNLPATQKHISTLATSIEDSKVRSELESISPKQVADKHISVFDLLRRFPSCQLPFGDYLSMLSPLRVRQYSISSSPLAHPTSCTLTYGVLDAPALASGEIPTYSDEEFRYLGTASNYLSSLHPGDRILVAVKPSHSTFHLPLDVENIPVIMCAAGSGLAPFRGFLEERAAQAAAGRTLAPAMLFVGCRHPDKDLLYQTELEDLEARGVVKVRYAFSRAPQDSEGCKYVQDRLWHDRKEVRELWKQGGRMFTCGSGSLGEGIQDAFIRAAIEMGKDGREVSREEAEKWFESIRGERFASDVFA